MLNDDKISFTFLGLIFHLEPQEFVKILLWVYMCLLFILGISVYYFDYEMTNADIPGGSMAGILVAYLIHIIKE